MHCSNRCGTASTSLPCRSPWPKTSEWRTVGAFYDSVGALRDVVQNHLLQVLALIAMEAPVNPGHRSLWDKKVEVFRAMADADPEHCVSRPVPGYLNIPGVHAGSVTENLWGAAPEGTIGVGRACRLHSGRQSARRVVFRDQGDLQAATSPCLSTCRIERTTSWC